MLIRLIRVAFSSAASVHEPEVVLPSSFCNLLPTDLASSRYRRRPVRLSIILTFTWLAHTSPRLASLPLSPGILSARLNHRDWLLYMSSELVSALFAQSNASPTSLRIRMAIG